MSAKGMEPGCAQVSTFDAQVQLSQAISLKRIADALEALDAPNEQGRSLSEKLYFAIYNSISQSRAG